jgi:hypothetical protein
MLCHSLLNIGYDVKAKNWVSSRANDHLRVCENADDADDAAEKREKMLSGDKEREELKINVLFASGAAAAGNSPPASSSSFVLEPKSEAIAGQARWYVYAKMKISKVLFLSYSFVLASLDPCACINMFDRKFGPLPSPSLRASERLRRPRVTRDAEDPVRCGCRLGAHQRATAGRAAGPARARQHAAHAPWPRAHAPWPRGMAHSSRSHLALALLSLLVVLAPRPRGPRSSRRAHLARALLSPARALAPHMITHSSVACGLPQPAASSPTARARARARLRLRLRLRSLSPARRSSRTLVALVALSPRALAGMGARRVRYLPLVHAVRHGDAPGVPREQPVRTRPTRLRDARQRRQIHGDGL